MLLPIVRNMRIKIMKYKLVALYLYLNACFGSPVHLFYCVRELLSVQLFEGSVGTKYKNLKRTGSSPKPQQCLYVQYFAKTYRC